jgi:hypothetical protein
MKLALAAFILSVIALGVAISQPLWNLYSTPTATAPQGDPIFVLTDHQIFQFDTSFNILNNGTGDAHDVTVILAFSGGPNAMSMSQFIPEIRNKTIFTFNMPLGTFQLTYGDQELGAYQGTVAIKCREIPLGKLLYFDVE